jgi:hypothetical protein
MSLITTLVGLTFATTNIASLQPDLETGFWNDPFSGFPEGSFCTMTMDYPKYERKCPGQTDVNPDAPDDKEPVDADLPPDTATILY